MKLSEKKLNTKSIIIITILLPILVMLVSSIAIYITAKSVQPGSVLDASLLSKEEYALPQENEEALAYLDEYIEKAVGSGILKYSGSTSVNIDKTVCENTHVAEIFSFAASSISGKMNEKYESKQIKYGEDATALKGLLPGSAPSDFTAEISGDDINLILNYGNVFSNMYFINDDKTAVRLFIKENEGVFSAINEKFIPTSVKFVLTADKKTEEIKSLSIVRSYDYSANIAFKNTLASIGTTSLEMSFTISDNYSFSFAGIKIQQEIMTFDKDGYDSLSVTPYTEENLGENEYSLEFVSSDDSVATVDENGQVTAVKESDKPVTITVKLEYLGREFTDSCLVYVVKKVETVKISETAKTLKEGEKFTLTGVVSPDDATIKDLGFLSSDESIVTVSDSGEVTAVAKGNAIVTVYSKQGYVASECAIIVTD